MSTPTVLHAADVDGLIDSLPGRQYKQDPPFWVFVALQDWLRENGNANILAYDSGDSIRIHPYPAHDTGERLTPREVYYLFEKPPAHLAAQLPRCYCPGHEDDGPDLVRSFVVRNKKSQRLGEYGLTCARRKNRCGYFAWLSDVYKAADLDVAPVGAGMLAHIGDAERKDAQRSKKLATKKRTLTTQRRPESDYGGTSSGTDATSDAYSSEPEVAAARFIERPAILSDGDGLLAAHARYSSPVRAKRAVSPPAVDRGEPSEEPASKRLRQLVVAPGGTATGKASAASPPTRPSAGEGAGAPLIYVRPKPEFVLALTCDGADETAWDREARRLQYCCGRVWEQHSLGDHACGAMHAEVDHTINTDADAFCVIMQTLDSRGAHLDDWANMSATVRRCCGRVWTADVFARFHTPCPNGGPPRFDD